MPNPDTNTAIKVLLIDDDEDDAMIAQDHLSRIGGKTFHVEWVSTFQIGIKKLLEQVHDICLVDYWLCSGTGLVILEEALKFNCHIPIIMITGTTDTTLRNQALKLGAADFLFKSEVNSKGLERVIDQVLARK